MDMTTHRTLVEKLGCWLSPPETLEQLDATKTY
jgi:hypothetical protein